MCLEWEKRGGSDGVNKCGRESLSGAAPSGRRASLRPFSRHVLLSAARVSPLPGDRCPSERTGLVRGSAGVPLKSLLSGTRVDVVAASPGAAAGEAFPGLTPRPRTGRRAGCLPGLGGQEGPGLRGDPGGADAARGSPGPLPPSPAAPRRRVPQSRPAASASQSPASPDPGLCPGPSPRDPDPAPSFFHGAPSRGCS